MVITIFYLKNLIMRKHIVAGNWKMNKNFQEGLSLAQAIKDLPTIALILKASGDIFVEKTNYEEAHRYYQRSLQIGQQLQNHAVLDKVKNAIHSLQNKKKHV